MRFSITFTFLLAALVAASTPAAANLAVHVSDDAPACVFLYAEGYAVAVGPDCIHTTTDPPRALDATPPFAASARHIPPLPQTPPEAWCVYVFTGAADVSVGVFKSACPEPVGCDEEGTAPPVAVTRGDAPRCDGGGCGCYDEGEEPLWDRLLSDGGA